MRSLEALKREIEAELARPVESRRAAVALHPASVRKLLTETLPLLSGDARRARPIVAHVLGEGRMTIVQPDRGRPFYRVHFAARPAAIALTGTDNGVKRG